MSEAQGIADDARAVGQRLNREVLARLRRANVLEYELAVAKARILAVETLCMSAQHENRNLETWEVREAMTTDASGLLPPPEEILATVHIPPDGVQGGEVIKFEQE